MSIRAFINRNSTFGLKLRLILTSLVVLVAPIFSVTQAGAAQITGRSVTIGTSVPSTATTYSFAFTVPSSTAIKSADFLACTTASGTCTTPTGFVNSSSTLTAQPTNLGAVSGWTVSTATAGDLRLSDSSNSTAPTGSQTVGFSGVTNPSTTNTTYFFRITTYSDAAWTTPIDTGTVAASTAAQIQVALTVAEALTFCTGTSITGQNCGTIAGTTVSLGTGSTTATASGTSVMAASTNAGSGYSVTVNGTTLTSGSNTVAALTSGGTSTVGTAQFGLNLAAANTTPAVGAAISGTGTGTASSNYGTNNTFRFNTGDTVATATGPTNANTFTVGYIANISGVTPPGTYTSNLTYIATANF